MKKFVFFLIFSFILCFPLVGSVGSNTTENSLSAAPSQNKTQKLKKLHRAPPSASKSSAPESLEKKEEKCTVSANLSALSETGRTAFENALQKAPCALLQTLRTVEVSTDENMPRALSGRYTLIIRSDAQENPEFESVLLHEFGHVIDLGGITGNPKSGKSSFFDGDIPIFQNDKSVEFYEISWEDGEKIREFSSDDDFVSGYAKTNVFEDFAETLHLYRMHGNTFRELTKTNEALRRKYEFMKTRVFGGKEFPTGKRIADMDPRPWDSTKL